MEKLLCFLEAKMPPESALCRFLLISKPQFRRMGHTPKNQCTRRYFQHVLSALVPFSCHISAHLRAFIDGFFHLYFPPFYSNLTHLSRFSPFHTFLAKPISTWRLTKANSFSTPKIILILVYYVQNFLCAEFILSTNGVFFWRNKSYLLLH